MRRQQAQTNDNTLPESLQVVLVQARIDYEKEDGGDLRRTGKGILDRRVLGEELGGEVLVRDVLVVRGERVALETEGADPELAAHVDLAVRVQDRSTRRLARYGLVEDGRKVDSFLERSVELSKNEEGELVRAKDGRELEG